MLNKRDYELLAECLGSIVEKDVIDLDQYDYIVVAFNERFEKEYPNFNSARWLEATAMIRETA